MNLIRAATNRVLTVRAMEPGDLTRLVHIEKETPAPRWGIHQFKADLRSSDRINLVAAVRSHVVGFVIARFASEHDVLPGDSAPRPAAPPAGRILPAPVRIQLLHLAVAADWTRRGVGHTLLRQFEQFLQQPGDRIQAAVPETNLPVQLLLRSSGYRAERILRAFYGSEDAYLMERRRG